MNSFSSVELKGRFYFEFMLTTSSRSQGPLLAFPWSERERETLENAGHVSLRIWEMTKYNIEGGAANSYHYSRLPSPPLEVMFCHLPYSGRHVTSVFQGLSLARSRGRDGEDPGDEVVHAQG